MKLLSLHYELPPPVPPAPGGGPGVPGQGPRQADGAALQGIHVEAGLRQPSRLQ